MLIGPRVPPFHLAEPGKPAALALTSAVKEPPGVAALRTDSSGGRLLAWPDCSRQRGPAGPWCKELQEVQPAVPAMAGAGRVRRGGCLAPMAGGPQAAEGSKSRGHCYPCNAQGGS